MQDPGDELEEIKREIVESRSLTIKTNNLVNGLAADIHSISKRQEGYERSARVNGLAFAFALLVAVGVGAKLIIEARVDAEQAGARDQNGKLQKLQSEVLSLKKREDGRLAAEQRAAEYQQLILQGDRKAVIDKWPSVSKLPLTRTERATFRVANNQFRSELSLEAYQAGLAHAREQRWPEAERSLRDSLAHTDEAPHSSEARYQLARALASTGRQQEAIPLLVRLSKSPAPREVLDDAMLLLAEAQLEIEAWNDAKSTLRSLIRRFPNSPVRGKARRLLAAVKLEH